MPISQALSRYNADKTSSPTLSSDDIYSLNKLYRQMRGENDFHVYV